MNRALVAAMLAACSSCAGRVDGESTDDVVLEGTVFWGPSTELPVDRAFVRVLDANKSQRCFVTSCDGSFVVRRGDVPSLVFPLSVSVERVDEPEAEHARQSRVVLRRMSSRVGHSAQCSACHASGPPTTKSAGPIVLFDDERAASGAIFLPSGSCAPGASPVAIACPEDR